MEQRTPAAASLERFRAALRIATVWPEGSTDPAALEAARSRLDEFQAFLAAAYPRFHAVAERTVLDSFQVVYRWAGSDPDLAPALLLAHYDVVPAEAAAWTADPFGAELRDGFVYGRGALDTKNSLIACLEAAEALAARGFRPRRDLYFAFGGDEERSGHKGAVQAAARFAAIGRRFAWLLDEGSAVVDRLLPGIDRPLALIGLAEKGFLNLELSVEQKPGHASRPPRVQAAAVLGRALDRLSRRPFPMELTPTVADFFRAAAPLLKPPFAWAAARPRLAAPLLFADAGLSPDLAALLRTTVAMTQLSGAPTDNVLPSAVRAVLNLRLLPGWSIDRALAFVRRAVADPRVKAAVSPARPASEPVPPLASGEGAPGWAELSAALAAAFPEAAVLPFLVTATSDSRHYAHLADAVYRFSPMRLGPAELAGIHGHDERISLDNLAAGIDFYAALIAAS
jgi:carboxypeptidase PM20D1